MWPEELEKNGHRYALDPHGFLEVPGEWDEVFAELMAERVGIFGGLSERHWHLIRYLRGKLEKEHTVPTVVGACSEAGLRLRELKFLFPTGYHRGACRVAGISFQFMLDTNYWLTCETSPIRFGDYRTSALGFLERFEDWDEAFAVHVAREWKLASGLVERHREVIRFLRESFLATGSIPSVYDTCRATRMSLAELGELFPPGYRRGACLMAGLPLEP